MKQNVSLTEAVVRYYVMMGVVLLGGFTGMWWISLFGLPIFLTAILGMCPLKYMLPEKKATNEKNITKIIPVAGMAQIGKRA